MSMSDAHDFRDKLADSEARNKELDRAFSRWYEIYPMPLIIDKIGIDRLWKEKEWKVFYSVEYKFDERTAETGNAFIETVSVDTENKPGWGYTCAAQILVYYIPQWHKAWVLSPMEIKNRLEEWKKKYREVPVQNNGYKTFGLLVPWQVFINGSWAEVAVPEVQNAKTVD